MEDIARIHDVGAIFEEIQKFMTSLQCEPEHFNGRIIFMSMFYGIDMDENEETQNNVKRLLLQLRSMPADSRSYVGHFGDLDERRNECHEICSDEPDGKWDKIAERMLPRFSRRAVILSFVPPALWK